MSTTTSYFITGGSGFIGRRVIRRLLTSDDTATIYALVRAASLPAFAETIADFDGLTGPDGTQRVIPIIGDLTAQGLGIDTGDVPALDHVIHLAAIYDMAADAASQQATNVEGTARVAEFARAHGALLHHISSVAVAGKHRGDFSEADFDLGQDFPSPYHRTKFEAEKVVRETEGLRWRVYRPAVVVGDSHTGEMDKVDGPYYFFGLLGALGKLPAALRIPMPGLGHTNIVPVDFVADAIVGLCVHADNTGTDNTGAGGEVFHLCEPRMRPITELYNALAPGFGGPRGFTALPDRIVTPLVDLTGTGPLRVGRDLLATQQGIPPAVLDGTSFPATFRSEKTLATLSKMGIEVPDLTTYGPRLWRYWSRELDPARHRRTDPRRPLVGKKVLITGGSRGIGKATARMCVARGADVIVVSRNAEELDHAVAELGATPGADGVSAGTASGYVCDVTDEESVAGLMKSVLAEHGHVDVLVNNAGRSIRRATANSVHRSHDYHRLMAVNFFGAVNMILAVLPHMIERQSGHIVNVTSIAAQTRGARFAGYAASKSALEAFSEATATETLSDHVTFTNVRLPLVRTTMIAPTEIFDNAGSGVWSMDKAASRVLRGIIARPATVSTPMGTLAEVGRRVAPRLTTRILHQDYLLFGESAASLRASTPQS